jgi:hypothetical protein
MKLVGEQAVRGFPGRFVAARLHGEPGDRLEAVNRASRELAPN